MADKDDTARLLTFAEDLVSEAKKAGATDADAVCVRSRSQSISVRNGKVEGVNAAESDDFALRVFVGKKVASISASLGADIKMLAERAVSMASVSPEDPYATLADPAHLAKQYQNLNLLDETELSAETLTDLAMRAEAATLGVQGVSKSTGAGASISMGGLVLVTSGGFSGSYMASRYGLGVGAIAGEGTGMERDHDGDSRLHFRDLEAPETIGQRAGERAVKRLNPRKVKTRTGVTVIYDPRVARGIVGHIASAINGASIARKTSFLKDCMGKQILKTGLNIIDDPLIVGGSSSRPFDGEGVTGERLEMVKDGILQHWFLSTSTANELGLVTNGRGVRGGNHVTPASTNLSLEPGEISPEELIGSLKDGFYVTKLIGHGANLVTGEYSRGASGFWIEDGKLTYPVSEITIASNMKDMFLTMTPANDIDRKYGVACPTLAIENMTIAGD